MNKQENINEVKFSHWLGKIVYELIHYLLFKNTLVSFFVCSMILGIFTYKYGIKCVGTILLLSIFIIITSKVLMLDYYNAKFKIYGVLTNYEYKNTYRQLNFCGIKYNNHKNKIYLFNTNMTLKELESNRDKIELMFNQGINMYIKNRVAYLEMSR